MQSTNVRQIKAALVEQAFQGTAQVSCPCGQVVAVSRWKGQLRVIIRGWRHWYPVASVSIERMVVVAPVAIECETHLGWSDRRATLLV